MKNSRFILASLILLIAITLPVIAWARAGGSGGGHSHSHSSHTSGSFSSSGSSYHTTYHNNPTGPVVAATHMSMHTGITWLIIIGGAIYIIYLLRQTSTADDDEPLEIKKPASDTITLSPEQIAELKAKVEKGFLVIQEAWSLKQLPMMRRFISDGVYQRFNAQFKMMNILGQENPITDVEIRDIQFMKYSVEGNYECMDVGIRAYAEDQFTSKKLPQFNSFGGGEEFVEYWSFIRRKDYKPGHDIFSSENCPQCDAPLNDKLQETARCSYCGAYLNNGEYDWVLCEITQDEDYAVNLASDTKVLQDQVNSLLQVYPAFSTHLLEDCGSNAFLQILIARTTGDADTLHRFSTNTAFDKIKSYITKESLVYDRIYLSAVELANLTLTSNIVRATVTIDYCSRMVGLKEDGSAYLYTDEIQKEKAVIVLMRELSDKVSKGSIFANACSNCGATQADHLSAVCAYCNSPLNDPKRDWVVDDFSNKPA
jgi:hypothetical protein